MEYESTFVLVAINLSCWCTDILVEGKRRRPEDQHMISTVFQINWRHAGLFHKWYWDKQT